MALSPVHMPRRIADSLAVGLSALCLLHCLALPVLVLTLPSLGMIAHASWLHAALFLIALPLSAWALYRGLLAHGNKLPVLLGSIGLSLLAIGVLMHDSSSIEIASTTLGAMILAVAHGWNMRL